MRFGLNLNSVVLMLMMLRRCKEASMPGSSPHYRKRGAKQVAKKAA